MKSLSKKKLEQSYRQHHHNQPDSQGFSMGKRHAGFKSSKAPRHIQQPTRGRGIK